VELHSTSDILSGCFGGGWSLPEWIPRASATALWDYNTHKRRKILVVPFDNSRLLGGHEFVIVRRPVFVVTLMANNTGKTFVNKLLCNISKG
jgi:hypothetical protein